MFEAYGIRVSTEPVTGYTVKRRQNFGRKKNRVLNKRSIFPQLPLLKALIDRLLQDGIEELLQVLGSVRKLGDNTETHTSNVITEYTVSTH